MRVQEEYPLPFPTCWKTSRPLPSPYHPKQEGTRGLSSFPTCWKYSWPLPTTYHPQQEGTRGVSSLFPHLLEVQQALNITQSPTTRGVSSSFPHLLEVQQAIKIKLSPTTRRYKWSILFLSPLAESTAGPYHHPITHNKRVQEEYHSLPTCWKYSRPLPSPYHPQQGVSSSFPHLLEVQQTLPITLPTHNKRV